MVKHREKPADVSDVMRDNCSPHESEAADTLAAVAEKLGIAEPRRFGRFTVVRRLGAGAMGVVYLAHDTDLDRPVAVKLLKSSRGGPAARERFMREARALARLRHPNVVAAFERGVVGELDFVAMEYVDGGTLAEWLAAEERSLDAVLDKFIQAAHGLSAAHDAEIVHRDFKPDNVLVGIDGRAQVADFGLANDGRPVSESADATDEMDADALTRTGAAVGTPAYMAPEVRAGEAASASADQFSFCVSLYEAIYGTRPEPDDRDLALPRTPRIPVRLRRALRRGLSLEPAERWPSVGALRRQLELSRRPRRLRWWLAGGALTVGLVVAVAIASGEEVCAGAASGVEEVWNPQRAGALSEAITTSGSQAAPIAEHVVARLDAYADALAYQATDACEAHETRGEQSLATYDLRLRCLGRRKVELDELVTVLSEGGPLIQLVAPRSLAQLVPPQVCADVEALHDIRPPPEDPAARERLAEIERLSARIISLQAAARFEEASELLTEARALAADVDDPRMSADVAMVGATLTLVTGKPSDALEEFRTVFAFASEAGDTRLAAGAAVFATQVASTRLHDLETAQRWRWLAEPLVNRFASDTGLAGGHWMSVGAVEHLQGNHEEAIKAWRRSIDAWASSAGRDDPRLADPMENIASSLRKLGRLEEALELQLEVDRITVAAYGEDNVARGSILNALGVTYMELERLDEAEQTLRLSRRLYESGSKRPSASSGHPINNLGIVVARRGEHEAAVELFDEAIARWEPVYGDEHPYVADALGNRGLSQLALGETDAAEASLARAVAILEAGSSETPAEFAAVLAKLRASSK